VVGVNPITIDSSCPRFSPPRRDGQANLALAQYLVEQEVPGHLGAPNVNTDFAEHFLVTVHPVASTAGSFSRKTVTGAYSSKVARKPRRLGLVPSGLQRR